MSHIINERYIESAAALFNECVDSHDYAGTTIVIEQLYRDGFEDEARDLEAQLLETPLSKFVISLDVKHL